MLQKPTKSLNNHDDSETSAEEPTRQRILLLPLQRSQLLIIGAITIGVIIASILYFLSLQPTPIQTTDSPNYTTILPENKTINSLGGWQRISPPDKEPVYAFSDKIADTAIIVTEQPIKSTASFVNNPETYVKNIKDIYEKHITDSSTVFYVGTSTKGPQSVAFSKENLLILIKSERKLTTEQWASYIQSLSSTNLKNVPTY